MQPARFTAHCPRTSRRTLAALLVSAFPFLAAAQTWTNPGTGDWFTGSNWSSGLAPATNGTATIDSGTAVISDQSAAVSSLTVGDHAQGTLQVTGGATLGTSTGTVIAANTDSEGIITVSDAGTTWNTQGLILGYRGTATLFITDDALLANTSAAHVGTVAGSSGTVDLNRGGRWTNTGELTVGLFGNGTFYLDNASELTATASTLGADTVATGSVTLAGASSWTNSVELVVGMSGTGYLYIYEGSTVSNTEGVIGYYGTSMGHVEVAGENSHWTNTESLYVGLAGNGRLKIYDQGRVTVGGDSVVRLGSSSEIRIGAGETAGTLDAATITATSGGQITFEHTEAAYEFSPAITGTVSIAQIGTGRTILSGANTFSGFTTINGGTLAAGAANVLSANSAIFINNGATLDLAGHDQTVGDLDSYNFATGENDSGSVSLGGATLTNLNRVTNNWAGSITGTGTLVKKGVIMNWYGVNLFTGLLQVDSGLLSAEATNTLSPHAVVSIASGATVQIGNKSQTIAGLSGAGSFTRGSGTLTINQALDTVFSGTLSGWGTVIKSGSGRLTLSGSNTISGNTSVEAGALIVNGSIGDTVLTVQSGAILGGAGMIYGSTVIASGARLAPGDGGPGTLTFTAGLTFASGSLLDLDLGAVSDKLVFSDGELLGSGAGTITVNLFDSGGFAAGTYDFIDATGAVLTNFDINSFELGTVIAGYTYTFTQSGNVFQLTASAIPEPAAFAALAGAATLGLTALRRRRK